MAALIVIGSVDQEGLFGRLIGRVDLDGDLYGEGEGRVGWRVVL